MSEENDSRTKRDEQAVKEAVEKLNGQFDFIQIFVGRYEGKDKGTFNHTYGEGDWFGRYGIVRQWMLKTDEDARIAARHYAKGDNL